MSHSIGERGHCDGPRVVAGQCGIRSLRHATLATTGAKPTGCSGLDLTGHGAKVGVDASKQINGDFSLVLSQAAHWNSSKIDTRKCYVLDPYQGAVAATRGS